MPYFRRNLWTNELEEVEFPKGRDVYGKPGPRKEYTTGWSSGFRSRSLAVHPDDVDKANSELKERGISAYHDPSGIFVTHSRNARNEALKYRGFFDKDAGYSDHAG